MRHCQNGGKKEAAKPTSSGRESLGRKLDAIIMATSCRQTQAHQLRHSSVSRGLWQKATPQGAAKVACLIATQSEALAFSIVVNGHSYPNSWLAVGRHRYRTHPPVASNPLRTRPP